MLFCNSKFRSYDTSTKNWEVLKPKLKESNNGEYWITKIGKNIAHDDEVNKALLSMGWTVIRFWGNEIKKDVDGCVRVVEETIFELEVLSDSEQNM